MKRPLLALLFASAFIGGPTFAQTVNGSPEATVDSADPDWNRVRHWTRPLVFDTQLPYRDAGFPGYIPPIRYNRAEGLVLGFRVPELGPDDWEWVRPVGQLGYAFALGSWRYDAGFEVRPLGNVPSFFGTKLGLRYRFNTTTDDLWKAPHGENSLAAIVFRNDFYDYYETQGWSVYLVQPLGRRVQLSAGYRSEEHRSIENQTSWSIFGSGSFRPNPGVDEGLMRSIVVAADAGRVRYYYDRPIGSALRVEYEIASADLGSDADYSRITADARTYGMLTKHTTYAARARAGYASEDAVSQKLLSIGGIGTVRGYPMNVLRVDRALMGNVEYGLADVDFFFDDVDFFGFADVAWTSRPGVETRHDELLAAAGVGVGLSGRRVRFELAFPLNDIGFGHEPSLWFRLNPQF